ncbi:MAG: 50S ribosomal protein L17, partial [Candidatus Omnitrophica bacterium]|nr:50S ribosomal protein L17 [Candidatus Omnitrophota bacterium]
MRHKRLNKRFGRNNAQRKQLINSLIRGLFLSYRIKTTVDKAREAKKLAEKIITLAKKANLAGIRKINSVLQDRALTRKLTKEIAPLFKSRASGYTRVIRNGFRRGDGAPLAILELVEMPVVEKKPKKEKKKKAVEPTEEAEVQPKPAETPAKEIKAKKPAKKKEP